MSTAASPPGSHVSGAGTGGTSSESEKESSGTEISLQSPSQAKENDQPLITEIEDKQANSDNKESIVALLNNKTLKKPRKMNGNKDARSVRNRAPPPLSTLSALRGPPLSSAAARQIMWDQYQPWVLSTYGDAAKTKTITTKKYARIVALLKSLTGGNSSLAPVLDKDGNLVPQPQESSTPPLGSSTSEAAKFKLWVKSKGFHLGPPPGHADRGLPHTIDTLYLPTGTDKVSLSYQTRLVLHTDIRGHF